MEMLIKKIPDTSGLVARTVLNTKSWEQNSWSCKIYYYSRI